jgi:hypothetical protein
MFDRQGFQVPHRVEGSLMFSAQRIVLRAVPIGYVGDLR